MEKKAKKAVTKIDVKQSFKSLSRFEVALWVCSLVFIVGVFLLCGKFDFAVITASLVGATALIFVSKGDPLGQILTVVFALFYSYISLKMRYYGEMITYLFMTSPIAIASVVSWIRNPFEEGKAEVEVSKLSFVKRICLCIFTAAVTWIFYYILKVFDTPNLVFSTISIATSFSASYLTMFRSQFYALAYAMNDIVLIVLWVYASAGDISYLPMIACFLIFLINDLYGFINWRRIEHRQNKEKEV